LPPREPESDVPEVPPSLRFQAPPKARAGNAPEEERYFGPIPSQRGIEVSEILEHEKIVERFEEIAILLMQAMEGARKEMTALGKILGAANASSTALRSSIARELSQRERQVLNLVIEGLTNKEIAIKLTLCTNTVKSHVHTILSKTGISSRLKLAAFVQEERKEKA
jgi:DNA-binding NarL/FixJ family response regulator